MITFTKVDGERPCIAPKKASITYIWPQSWKYTTLLVALQLNSNTNQIILIQSQFFKVICLCHTHQEQQY